MLYFIYITFYFILFIFLAYQMFQIHVTYKNFCFTSVFAEKVKKESAKGCTSSLSDGQQDVKPSQEDAKNTSKKGEPVHRDYL